MAQQKSLGSSIAGLIFVLAFSGAWLYVVAHFVIKYW